MGQGPIYTATTATSQATSYVAAACMSGLAPPCNSAPCRWGAVLVEWRTDTFNSSWQRFSVQTPSMRPHTFHTHTLTHPALCLALCLPTFLPVQNLCGDRSYAGKTHPAVSIHEHDNSAELKGCVIENMQGAAAFHVGLRSQFLCRCHATGMLAVLHCMSATTGGSWTQQPSADSPCKLTQGCHCW
jgi:hypothetical protein